MILFIFEGKKCEPRLFETLKHLFFAKETEPFVCTYNSNIYANQYLIPQLKIRVINAMAIFPIVCTRSPDVDLTFIAL